MQEGGEGERARDPAAPHVRPEIVAEVSTLLHERLGAFALESWGGDEALVGIVGHHHRPEALEAPQRPLAWALRSADALAHWLEARGAVEEGSMSPELLESLELDAVRGRALGRDVHAQFETLAALV